MSHNYEFALSHVPVDDRYVMIIGDDDGIVPGALEQVAALIRATKVKALNSTFVMFTWPNASNENMGRLLVPMRRGFEIRDSLKCLRRAVSGRAWYSDLPMLYAGGVTHMSLVDAGRRKQGHFYRSCQPDVFSSIVLSASTDRFAFSHEPFVIAGHSRHSNGASNTALSKGDTSSDVLGPALMFNSESNIPWHADIPTLPGETLPLSIDLLVYESYLQAAQVHETLPALDREQQLALFLARRISDEARMAAWAPLFAERHGIDLVAVKARAGRLRPRVQWWRLVEQMHAMRDLYRLEPKFGVRMRDVYDAGVVAAAMLATRPNRLRSYVGTLAKHLTQKLGGAIQGGVPT